MTNRYPLLVRCVIVLLMMDTQLTSAHLTASSPVQVNTFNRVCYLRPDTYFPINLVFQLDLCTHLIVGFSSIDANQRLTHDRLFPNVCSLCRQAIRNHSSSVKLMFSIGGGGAGGFELATSNSKNRKRFVESITDSILKLEMDGVDIDWEFPSWGFNVSKRIERDNMVYLLKELREKFDLLEQVLQRRLILSAAVAAQVTIVNVSYKPIEIAKYVDFINLMTYDFYIYKWYWPFIGHNSALHGRSAEFGLAATLNTEWSSNHWNMLGLHKRQIMIGIPTYGKRFTLYSKYFTYPGSLAVSSESDCTYSDVCDFLNLNNTIELFDQEAKVPYAYNDYEWISFENSLSAKHKAEWIKMNQFGGAMLFSLNADDYRIRCEQGLFPIHSTVRDILRPNASPLSPT